jgi:hypothetical protein
MELVRYADRPDLRAIRYQTLSRVTFPEYMQNNEPGNRYWGRLYEDHPQFQLALLDGDELVAELHSVPTPWDGSDEDRPSGWTRRSSARSRAGGSRRSCARSRSRFVPTSRVATSPAGC